MRFNTGSRLGPYEIRAVIDQGGMGEVYRALDTRLDRTVAIKVINAEHSQDRSMRLRFAREAKALSNLRHPHICALYDVGEEGDSPDGPTPFLVMEYLEGQTLDKLLKRGPLPFDRVLRYGIEIADALHQAHRQHILHRDLKPANVMITEHGTSLLDFGLAKILAPALPADLEIRSDTSTAERSFTPAGSVVGTVFYMSPEQVEGKEPDVRTDIFALGVCLYQMATGQRPFDGQSRASLIGEILQIDPPPPSTLRPSISPSFDWVVKRCLAKDPEERFQSAYDVKLELERIAESEAKPARSVAKLPYPNWWFVAALLLALSIAFAAYLRIRSGEHIPTLPAAVRRLSLTLPPQAGLASGISERLAVSPDGSRIAYVADGDPPSLYLYSLNELSAKPLARTENARSPFFSPDGRWVGFSTADGYLKKIAVDGGAPITIGKTGEIRGAAWGENNEIVFGSRWSPLKLISARNGAITVVPQQNPSGFDARWPVFLPDGKRILFTSFDVGGDYENAQLAVFDPDRRTTTVVLQGGTFGRFIPPGQLIYFRSGTLYSVPFDLRALRVTGEPTPRASDADYYVFSGVAQFAIAADGTLFYVPRDAAASDGELVWTDRNGHVTPIANAHHNFGTPRLSPDGSRILVMIEEGITAVLWIYDISRQSWLRLAQTAGGNVWAPNGKNIAFSSNQNGAVNIFMIAADGSTPARQITHTSRWPFANSWSPDGRELAVVEQYKETLVDIYMVPIDHEAAARPFLATPSNESEPVFSPDGAWLAYQSDTSGRYEIYVVQYPNGGRRWLVSTDGGREPQWRRDGKELFYRNGTKFMAVDVSVGSGFAAGKPRLLFEGDSTGSYDVAPDGSKFLMVKRPKPGPRMQINVISGLAGAH